MASIRWDNLGESDYQPADWIDFGGGGETGGKSGGFTIQDFAPAPAPAQDPFAAFSGGGGAPQPWDPYYSAYGAEHPGANTAAPIGTQLSYTNAPMAAAASGGGGRTAESIVDDWFANQNIRGHQDKNVWINYLKNANGGLTDQNINYFLERFREDPNNNPHTGEVFGGGTRGQQIPPTSAFGYDDPSSMLYLTQALQRLSSLNQQQQQVDPFQQLLQLFGLNRVNDLSGAPYTAGEDAALRTRYLEPLTQARDAALRQNKERVGARGMLPSSGLLDVLNRGTNADYQKAVGSAANDTAIQAINEKQRRAQEQLATLASLLNVSRSAQDRQNALGKEAVTTAELFPLFDERRLDQLLRASGEGATSPTSALSALTGLGNLNLNTQQLNDRNSANSAAAWGQILGYILGAL
jgi:hypothetical protein